MFDKEVTEKDIEKFHISWLFKELNINDEDVTNSESPDFIIKYDGRKIGIEVVSCHSLEIESNGKLSRQKTDDYLHDLLKEYEKDLKEQGESHCLISVSFDERVYQVRRLKKVKDEIIDEINGCREYLKGGAWNDCKYVHSVDEYKFSDDYLEVNRWEVFWPIPAKPENILKCIEQKEKKLPTYYEQNKDKGIVEYWLVVDFVYDGPSDVLNVVVPNVQTGFERVYLVKYGDIFRVK